MDKETRERHQPDMPDLKYPEASWTRWLLRLYPHAWRKYYGEEVMLVLAEHQITARTIFDLLLGALDAHLHRELLPGAFSTLTSRLRQSEVRIFCSFLLFCFAWMLLRLVRDPLSVWRAATAVHPELLAALNLLDAGGSLATLAMLIGVIPLMYTALVRAVATRRWKLLGLFVIPMLALVLALGATFILLPISTIRQPSATGMLFTPLAVVFQVSIILVWLAAIGGSVAAVTGALSRSDFSERLLRFALLPAQMTVGALVLGLIGALALTVLIFVEEPLLSPCLPLQIGEPLLMGLAVMFAGAELHQGMGALSAASPARGGFPR